MAEDLCTRRIADYSETAMPYVFTFDGMHSSVTPDAEGNQLFSYILQAYGTGTEVNLRKFTFSGCDKILADDIVEFRYAIYNNQQVVTDIVASYAIGFDPDTQETGLTITFSGDGLSSNDAFMMTFELIFKGNYTLSEVGVTMFGADGTTRLDGQSVCGPVCDQETPCENIVPKWLTVNKHRLGLLCENGFAQEAYYFIYSSVLQNHLVSQSFPPMLDKIHF